MPHTKTSTGAHLGESSVPRVEWFKAKLQCELGPVELKRLIDEKGSIQVIDVRDADSFASEHVPGAMNVPLHDIPKRLASIPKEKTIVCYCWSATCFMAAKACLDLAQRDFKVLELVGGIKSWKEAGFEIEGGKQKPGHA